MVQKSTTPTPQKFDWINYNTTGHGIEEQKQIQLNRKEREIEIRFYTYYKHFLTRCVVTIRVTTLQYATKSVQSDPIFWGQNQVIKIYDARSGGVKNQKQRNLATSQQQLF